MIDAAEIMWMIEKAYLLSMVMLLAISYSGLTAIAKLQNTEIDTILNKLFF